MEHSLTQIPELRSPWRTATLVASAIAAIELVALLVLGVTLLAEPVAQRVTQTAEAKELAATPKRRTAPSAGAAAMPRSRVSVMVLNGNGRTGAAGSTAERTQALGYTIGGVGNAPRTDYTRSVVMYRKGYAPEAQRLAKDLRLKIVGPLDGLEPAELLGAHVAVVVGE
ncbi:MAG: LytR C-terminal domain-containing protein [Gaiellaceae bacterium MAG52_C11]|nr:LytR C-terminal domain-containing protein [Candidatus Gaiellasilicea maunaloa]